MERFEEHCAISGIGQSEVGRRLDRDPLELTLDACLAAIEDAGLRVDEVDGLSTYPGNFQAEAGFTGANLREVHDALHLKLDWYNSGVESMGQLGSVVNACLAVASGLATHVLCFRSLWEGTAQGKRGRQGLGSGSGRIGGLLSWQIPFGAASAAPWHAMQARVHFERYGTTREQLGWIAVNARRNAALNEKAVYREPISIGDYLDARMIAEPLGLYDCDVPCDGATAIVVSRRDRSPYLRREPVLVEAVGTAIRERWQWEQSEDLARFHARYAAEHLWSRTDLRPGDVHLAGLYDGFSILCLGWLEEMGFCGLGEGGAFVEGGERIALDGELPLSTDGGQLSGGRLHGYGFLHEACVQLRGEGGARQVPGEPQIAAIGVGGAHSGCTAMLLTRA